MPVKQLESRVADTIKHSLGFHGFEGRLQTLPPSFKKKPYFNLDIKGKPEETLPAPRQCIQQPFTLNAAAGAQYLLIAGWGRPATAKHSAYV